MKQVTTLLPEYITNLMDKINGLGENEILQTAFGPEDKYKIERGEDGFLLSSKGIYFTSRWRAEFIFQGGSQLLNKLKAHPYYIFYAKNVFSGKEDAHMDNISNFCNSFKKHKTD